ncbi:hypothetical protein [Pendulispora albinea]|uniref:Lipoprotein n=1 Tax=Pendulispora albinea TaxID=2741071 RepID=A0ABZ2LZP1_9BACT
MNPFSRLGFVAPFALLAGSFVTGCAEEAYVQPVQPTVHGRASLMAIPPREPAPMSEPGAPVDVAALAAPLAAAPAPVAPAAPAPAAPAPSTDASPRPTSQVGPLPALPSQAPRYLPPPQPAPRVVYRTVPSYVYYNDYPPPYYYYRPRSSFYTGFAIGTGVGIGFGFHRHHHHHWHW